MRTDIENMPTDQPILVGTMAGEVFISRLLSSGRWSNMATGSWPIAWDDVPAHPYFPDATRALVTPNKTEQPK